MGLLVQGWRVVWEGEAVRVERRFEIGVDEEELVQLRRWSQMEFRRRGGSGISAEAQGGSFGSAGDGVLERGSRGGIGGGGGGGEDGCLGLTEVGKGGGGDVGGGGVGGGDEGGVKNGKEREGEGE